MRQVAALPLDAKPVWWFGTTHAGHLDICREQVDGGQYFIMDEPST